MPPAGGAPDMGAMPGGMTPGASTPTGAQDMASPEQKQQLMDLIDQIRSQLGELNALQFAHTNQSLQQKNDLLKEVYSELQAAGVDLTDPQSVAQFIEQLKKKSPDLAQLFEQSMMSLLGAPQPASSPDMGSMGGGMPDMSGMPGANDMQNPTAGATPPDMNNAPPEPPAIPTQ